MVLFLSSRNKLADVANSCPIEVFLDDVERLRCVLVAYSDSWWKGLVQVSFQYSFLPSHGLHVQHN